MDKYPVIVKLWQWLQKQEPEDIDRLPRLKEGQRVSELGLCEEASYLLGFFTYNGVESPRDTAGSSHTQRPNRMNHQLNYIARNLHKIRHWEIICDDYRNVSNQEATWFIDPPYQFGGEHYVMNNKGWDYGELAAWCQSRSGQVIVCENTRANWMPFVPMYEMVGNKHRTTEAMWTNFETHYHYKQGALI